MKQFYFILVLVCFSANVYCGKVHFSDCSSGYGYDLRSVDIDGCLGHSCPLLMLSSVNVTIELEAKYEVRKVIQEIVITTKMINFKTTSSPEPCSIQRPCPIYPGDASFSTHLWIPDIAPFTSRLTWRMVDEDSNIVMCFYANIHLCYENDTDPLCYN